MTVPLTLSLLLKILKESTYWRYRTALFTAAKSLIMTSFLLKRVKCVLHNDLMDQNIKISARIQVNHDKIQNLLLAICRILQFVTFHHSTSALSTLWFGSCLFIAFQTKAGNIAAFWLSCCLLECPMVIQNLYQKPPNNQDAPFCRSFFFLCSMIIAFGSSSSVLMRSMLS